MKTFISPKEALQTIMSPNETLRYQPIDRPNEIRLVKILPGLRISPVKCELQSEILGPEPPKYVALSYCWGNANDKTWVNCNGQRLALTKDLLNAIRRLRRKDNTVTLWIDQICINQEDLEERNSQVSIMRKIYETATNVLIWLGDEADDSNMAIELIPRLNRTLPHFKVRTTKELQPLKALLSRPWFGRMWVLQELWAASSATIVCGNKSIPWQDVSDLIDRMTYRGLLWGMFGSSESSLLACRRLADLKSIREGSPGGGSCAYTALYVSRDFDATDPRDKIYASPGLSKYHDYCFHPDYSTDIRTLYLATARVCLFAGDSKVSANPSIMCSKHSGMRFLCEAERSENTYNLPSWVPDWRVRSYPNLQQNSSETCYSAAGMSKTRITLTEDPHKISLAGKIGDAVYLLSSIAPLADDGSPNLALCFPNDQRDGLFQKVPQSCWINEASLMAARCHRYRDNASRDAAFGTTIIGNNAVYDSYFHGHTNIEYALYYWHFRQLLSKLCPNGVVNGASIQQLYVILHQHIDGYQHIDFLYQTVAQGRRFFTTLGGYMGIGPPGMRSGDLVCVFLGGNIPWIIRQDGHEYSLVGECYVHGIMDGEFIQTENLPVQDIIVK